MNAYTVEQDVSIDNTAGLYSGGRRFGSHSEYQVL
jgi:hypothetical protein